MNATWRRTLFWAPRVLTVAFALFLSLFALDVFSQGYGFREAVLALLMHLVPSFLVLIFLAVAWRWPRIGGLVFLALGAAYAVDQIDEPVAVLGISGPLFLVGLLWIVSGLWGERRPTPA